MKAFKVVILFLLVCLVGASTSIASETTIWSIGEEDGSNAEFAIPTDPFAYLKTFPNDVQFTFGVSDPKQNWAGFQPGPGDAWGGNRSNVFAVSFDLPEKRTGNCLLKIRLIGYHPNEPVGMRVSINGKPLTIGFPSGGHMDAWQNFALATPFHFNLPLPESALRSGSNRIEITSQSCWLIWDSLSLVQTGDDLEIILDPDSLNFEILPLFEKHRGRLQQHARISFLAAKPIKQLKARITINGKSITCSFRSDHLGYVSEHILIPEIKEPGEAKLEVLFRRKALYTKTISVKPSRKWTIAIVPQAHVDVGYTHLQEEAMDIHRKSNDMVLQMLEKYPDFVWSVESSYVMQDWIKTRPKELIDYFFEKSKSNRIEVEAFYGNLLTGLLSDEEAFRSLYYSKQLSREHDITFASATLTDSPSHIWSIPTVLRKSGVKYLSMGINPTRAPLLNGGLYERSPIWWEGPDGSKVLAFFHSHYAGAAAIGLTAAWPGGSSSKPYLTLAENRIPNMLRSYDRPDYPYDSIHIHGAYGDNQPLTEQLPANVKEWSRKYEYPKIVFTTNTEWFSSFDAKYGKRLDSVSGDGGAYWEDGAGSSARETAINRQNQQQALLAEMLLTGLHAQGKMKDDYRSMFTDIWHDIMLYNEHTWGAHNSIASPELPFVLEQYKVKSEFAYSARQRIRPLLQIARQHFSPGSDSTTESAFKGNRLESESYQITFDPERGGISSIVDKETGRELIDSTAPYLLGQLIYARNAKPPYDFSVADYKGIESKDGEVILKFQHERLPVIEMKVRVNDARKKIEFEYNLNKIPTYEKEGIYIAFPFAGNNPQIDYAIANAVVRAGRDWLPGACKDWFTLQNWLRVRERGHDSLFVTFDAPLINLQDINANKWLEDLPIENGHVYAYIMNNYWFTNYKASQGGVYTFRFAITSDKHISFADAVQFGRDWNDTERAAIGSMIKVSPENIIVSGFKCAESGDGYIVRLREMSGNSTNAQLEVPALKNISNAMLCNGVEDELKALPVVNKTLSIDLKPWDIVTIKVNK